MLTLTHVERHVAATGADALEQSIGWVLEGHAFVIRDKDRFCVEWVPIFFGQAKFSSFTRKLYRWGFRKVNMAPHQVSESATLDALYFGNEYFQRGKKELLLKMKSVTAAKTRTEQALESKKSAVARPGPSTEAFQRNFQLQSGVDVAAVHHQVLPLNPLAPQQVTEAFQRNFQLQSGVDAAAVHHQVLPLNPLAPQQVQTQQNFGQLFANPINQAALLQALNVVTLQNQLAAAQTGPSLSAPIDPTQLLASVISFAASAQAQQPPNMNPLPIMPQAPMVQAPTQNQLAAHNVPVAPPAQSQFSFLLPFALSPPVAAPSPPQLGIVAPPALVSSDPGFQERLWQVIQMLLAAQNGQQQSPPPGP